MSGTTRPRALVSLVRERGPVPWDRQAAEPLVARAGLSPAAAALVLAGIPGLQNWNTRRSLPTPERAILKFTAGQIRDAHHELLELTNAQRVELLADVLPADPAELWEPGGLREVADRAAQRWSSLFGTRIAVPARTIEAATAVSDELANVALCEAIVAPHTVDILTTGLDIWLEEGGFAPFLTSRSRLVQDAHDPGRVDVKDLVSIIETMTNGVRWAYAGLPAGDPVRAGAPAMVELLRERLADPELLLPAGKCATRLTADEVRALFGPEAYAGPKPLTDLTADDGLTVAAKGWGTVDLYFRPAYYLLDSRSETLRTTAFPPLAHILSTVEWLLGEACDAMMERIRSAALPAGRSESDPRACVPALVAEAAERLGVESDPAALYLQLLTLLRPVDRDVRAWNEWGPARHKRAVATLVERGLVVEDRRTRAGRGVFLPGEWTAATKSVLPYETWKNGLHDLAWRGDLWPRRPLPDLFAAAWNRVENGDGPG